MKYIDDINEFEVKFKRIDKLLLLGNFFKQKRLILTALEEQASAGKLILTSILKFHHMKGEIKLTNQPEKNIEILKNEISKDLEIELEVLHLLELMELNKKHKKSPVEFMRKKKVVILDENQNIETITIERLKSFKKSISTVKLKFKDKISEKN